MEWRRLSFAKKRDSKTYVLSEVEITVDLFIK